MPCYFIRLAGRSWLREMLEDARRFPELDAEVHRVIRERSGFLFRRELSEDELEETLKEAYERWRKRRRAVELSATG